MPRRDPKAAVAAYDEARRRQRGRARAAGSRGGARRALLVDTRRSPRCTQRLEPLTAADRPFRHTARELLALAAWRAGDARGGKALVRHDHDRSETPAGTRTRVEMLMALVASRGQELRGVS